ncbi:MAG: hypothetical protein Ct9H300mP15_26000 [Gemmatimonadota bacterium]|nr:MAG: hypothetical protein Ct9H300mP15_26000 [Gemmatimonadota bacterium]
MTEVDIDPTEQGYHPPYLAAILAACGVPGIVRVNVGTYDSFLGYE